MIQCQVINKILDTRDSSLILLNNLTDEYFSDYLNEFYYVKNHLNKYGNIPDKASFLEKFPDFDLLEVNETDKYLIEELYQDRNKRKLASVFNKVRDLLNDNKTDDALKLYTSAASDMVKAIHLDSVDILTDTSRYDDYIDKCQDFNKFYVKTGFPELDELIGGWDKYEELATLAARPGVGKCLAKGTEVLMSDGTLKKVEDIKVGDKVQSLDRVNTVLALHNGVSKGYKIIPNLGEPFIVSENHILTCMVRNHVLRKGDVLHTTDNTFTLKDISIEDYLKLSPNNKAMHLLYRPVVNYPTKNLLIPPYILGAWLGDGTSCRVSITNKDAEIVNEWCDWGKSLGLNIRIDRYTYDLTNKSFIGKKSPALELFRKYDLISNKHIPLDYLTGDTNQRLELLAGILDTDGYLGKRSFSLCLKSKLLIKQVAQLARGLGFRVGKIKERVLNNKKHGLTSYFTINISGNIETIPTRLPRKQAIKSTSNRELSLTNFVVQEIPQIEYYGFMADGDHRYLLWDNTLTHNTWILFKVAIAALEQGLRVGVYSGEMSERKVGYRFDTLLGHISNSGLLRGNSNIQLEYKKHIESLKDRFSTCFKVLTPAMINGPAGVTALRAFIEKENLDILFVDQHSLL